MLADALRLQYRHSVWAMNTVFDAAEKLTAEQRAVAGHAGHGSIQETLQHVTTVHLRWLAVFERGLSVNDMLGINVSEQTATDLAALGVEWDTAIGGLLAYVNRMTDAELGADMLVQTPWTPDTVVPRYAMLLHVLSEAAQHRSEVAAMLTEQGSSPGPLDLAFFVLVPGIDAG